MIESILVSALTTIIILVLFIVGWGTLRMFFYATEKLEFARNCKDYVIGYSILIGMLFLLVLSSVIWAKSIPTLNTHATVTAEAE